MLRWQKPPLPVCAFLVGDGSDKAFSHLKSIRQAIEDLHIPHDPSVSQWVTASIGGITVIPKEDLSFELVLKTADAMLYDAKKGGRNRVIWADEKMNQLYEKRRRTNGAQTTRSILTS